MGVGACGRSKVIGKKHWPELTTTWIALQLLSMEILLGGAKEQLHSEKHWQEMRFVSYFVAVDYQPVNIFDTCSCCI